MRVLENQPCLLGSAAITWTVGSCGLIETGRNWILLCCLVMTRAERLEAATRTDARVLDVTEIAGNPGATRAFTTEFPVDEVSVPLASVSGTVSVDGVLEGVVEGVVLVCRIRAELHETCRRCLEEGVRPIEVEVTELFTSGPAEVDDETYHLVDSKLDLDQCTRDALALELPDAPLRCEGPPESCPNLAAICEHGYQVEPDDRVDPRWAPLSGLITDQDKES